MKKRVVALVMVIVLVLSMSVAVLAAPTGQPMFPSLFSCSIPCTIGETYTYPAYYENMP